MQRTLTATDAGRSGQPRSGPEVTEDHSRPAPMAAKLEISPWVVIRFDMALAARPPRQFVHRKSQIANRKC